MPASDLPLLIDAALAGGQIALDYWRRDPDTETKPDGSPVSVADIEVDRALRESLTRARPGYGWLSEETADTGARLSRSRCFILDPIDGTRAYLEGKKTWAVSLAIVEAGRPTAGVVHMPVLGKTYVAAQGQGAMLNGHPIAVSAQRDADGASVLASRPTYAERNWRGDVPAFERHFRPSMAYRLALVAEGRFDAMMTLKLAWEWDIAAGSLLAEEAGARVVDRHGAALSFNSPGRQTAGILVANPDLVSAIGARLA